MNDLDDFRAALRQPPAEPFAEPDLAKIMADGTRIRRRRRVLTSTAGIAAAAVVVLVVVFAVQLRQPAPAPVAQPPSISVTTPPSTTTGPPPSRLAARRRRRHRHPDQRRRDRPLRAGRRRAAAAPGHPLRPGGRVPLRERRCRRALATNEVTRPDRSFGFHATDGGELSATSHPGLRLLRRTGRTDHHDRPQGRPSRRTWRSWSEDPRWSSSGSTPPTCPSSGVTYSTGRLRRRRQPGSRSSGPPVGGTRPRGAGVRRDSVTLDERS